MKKILRKCTTKFSTLRTKITDNKTDISDAKKIADESLKINKISGDDGVSFNVIKKYFGELCEPLKYLFNLSIVKGIFSDYLKIAKVTPIYKADSSNNVSNYRPISVLPWFSKMVERIMHNRLQKYLKDQNILHDKQFGFQTGHSTDHAIAQLVEQI